MIAKVENVPETDFCEFERLTKPLIKFLNDKYHPHTAIFISTTHAELSEGVMAFSSDEFIKD